MNGPGPARRDIVPGTQLAYSLFKLAKSRGENPTMAENNIISDSTYNLLAILLSKLEGLEAYDTYLEDMDGDGRKLIEQIRRDDERHAEMLRAHVEGLIKDGGL